MTTDTTEANTIAQALRTSARIDLAAADILEAVALGWSPGGKRAKRAKADADQPVLIFSGEHGAFWRADGNGYTIRADMAGQWRHADAMREIDAAGPEKMLTLVPLRPALAAIPEGER